jgi:hypothetical protein
MATRTNIHHPAADRNSFTVEAQEDDTALVRVEGATLSFVGTADTPRVRDIDLAEWFGYERPRDIRKLLKRMEREGKLKGIDWRATVARQSTGNGASREYRVTEAWLTQQQSLLVATQAEGDRAWALTEAMAQVFEAVLSRRPQGLTAEQVAQMIAAAITARPQAPDNDRIERMILDRDANTTVLAPIRRMAASLCGPRATRADRARHIGRLHCRVRREVGWSGMWRLFPRHRIGDLLRVLHDVGIEVERMAAELAYERQPSLKLEAA